MPAQMLLDRPELLDKLDQIGLALSARFIAFLPLVLWRRHSQGRLDRQSVKEMLASASPLLPTLLTGPLVRWRSSSASVRPPTRPFRCASHQLGTRRWRWSTSAIAGIIVPRIAFVRTGRFRIQSTIVPGSTTRPLLSGFPSSTVFCRRGSICRWC